MDYEAKVKKARNLVLKLLGYRARSIKEVRDYLERKGFNEEITETIIDEMIGYGYLNDRRFAIDFINYRKERGYGKKKVRYELFIKGLDQRIIEELISKKFNREDDLSRIMHLLEKRNFGAKKSQLDRDEEYKLFQREASFLKRRGYQDDLILYALKNYNISE